MICFKQYLKNCDQVESKNGKRGPFNGDSHDKKKNHGFEKDWI